VAERRVCRKGGEAVGALGRDEGLVAAEFSEADAAQVGDGASVRYESTQPKRKPTRSRMCVAVVVEGEREREREAAQRCVYIGDLVLSRHGLFGR
jgi:hypothetical protein